MKSCYTLQHELSSGMNLEDLTLRELSQSQRVTFMLFHLHEVHSQNHRESRMVATRCWREREMGVIVSGLRAPVLLDEGALEVDGGDGCTSLRRYLISLNCALKKVTKTTFI